MIELIEIGRLLKITRNDRHVNVMIEQLGVPPTVYRKLEKGMYIGKYIINAIDRVGYPRRTWVLNLAKHYGWLEDTTVGSEGTNGLEST